MSACYENSQKYFSSPSSRLKLIFFYICKIKKKVMEAMNDYLQHAGILLSLWVFN